MHIAPAFPVFFALGAAALALWVDERAAPSRPESVTRRIGHAGAAIAAFYLVGSVSSGYAETGAATRLALLFCAFLPCCIYLFLTAAWLVWTLADLRA